MTTVVDELVQSAKDAYKKAFDSNPQIVSTAPGRVNLIGEHVDYNDGFVLPMALPMVTVIVGSLNDTESTANIITFCSGADETNRVKLNLANITASKPKWLNYIKGVIHNFGREVPGFNAVIMTNIPVGSGLSSSAALEVSTLTFLEAITGHKIESLSEKALICQKAEHDFVGMPCGIMDQLISVGGRKDNVLLLDCRSLETFQIPFKSEDLAILICNSNVRHELSSSEYPTRRRQCSLALQIMKLNSYREATEDNLKALNNEDPILLKRARHVITEIKRTWLAADSLKEHDFVKMGKLMTESHTSLRDDFEVSCPELDVLVESAIKCKGVLGSRMTGGGFGGCTVTLLEKQCIDDVIQRMRNDFQNQFQGQLEFYVCTPSDGAKSYIIE